MSAKKGSAPGGGPPVVPSYTMHQHEQDPGAVHQQRQIRMPLDRVETKGQPEDRQQGHTSDPHGARNEKRDGRKGLEPAQEECVLAIVVARIPVMRREDCLNALDEHDETQNAIEREKRANE